MGDPINELRSEASERVGRFCVRRHVDTLCGLRTFERNAGKLLSTAVHTSCTTRGMTTRESFRGLKVWQVSMTLVEEIYRTTKSFPPDERFGLTAQIRRAGVSIPSNIAEGKRRKKERVYLNHLDIALGSQAEVDVQLEIANRVGYLRDADYRRLARMVDEVGRMLNGLISSMQPQGGSLG